MKFQDLPEDIIRSIFSFCDIYRVLSMSRTNKYLRPLSLDRLVWVDLVASLWRKGFVDQLSLSDIQASSQEALVDLVKSLLTGPASWTGPVIPKSRWFRLARSPTCPIVQVGAKYAVHPPGVLPSNLKQPKLLNGGEYVLFNNVTLECWNVRRDELVWAYDRGGPEFQVAEFAAEVVDEGDSVNLIVCERSWTHSGNDQSLVQILKLDLTTGSSTPLLQKQNPDGKVYNFIDARISGDIACFVGTPWRWGNTTPFSECILINWKTKSQLELASNTLRFPFLVTLIPNHLIWVSTSTSDTPEISVIKISTALSCHWRSISAQQVDPPETVYTSKLQATVRENITFSAYLTGRGLYAYPSPLEEGTYRIWVSLYDYSRSISKEKHAVLCGYRLSLSNRLGDKTLWRQRTMAFTDAVHTVSGFSYSGHSAWNYTIVGPNDRTGAAEIQLSATGGSSRPHISTYSGALVSLARDKSLFVVYCR